MTAQSPDWPRVQTRRRWTPVDAHTLGFELTAALITRDDRYRPVDWREWQVRRNGRDLATIIETQEGQD